MQRKRYMAYMLLLCAGFPIYIFFLKGECVNNDDKNNDDDDDNDDDNDE